ncbi:MAG: ribonuclease H-like domain-containing protein [Thermoplasmata archaeon]|nr:ribonuclease H-like domain-containing protein [Thermoplasmata archaeon]
MLRSTFLHLPGVGAVTEVRLWRRGLTDWQLLSEEDALPGLGSDHLATIRRELAQGEAALRDLKADWFAHRLPPSEHWRLHPEFRNRTAFLDIETTGLSPHEGIVTVVGVHGRGEFRSFVADEDLEEMPAYLRRFEVLVTFNGSVFDVPFLEATFPHWVPPPAHIDLRFLLRRLGYSGGLKRIEQQLGLGDRSGVEGIHGLDAVRLWEEFRRGRADSLARLVKYNRADTVNLEPLLDFAVREMTRRLLGPARLEAYTAPG